MMCLLPTSQTAMWGSPRNWQRRQPKDCVPEVCAEEQDVSILEVFCTSEVAEQPLSILRDQQSMHHQSLCWRFLPDFDSIQKESCLCPITAISLGQHVQGGWSWASLGASHLLAQTRQCTSYLFPVEHITSQLCLKIYPDSQLPDSFIYFYLLVVPWGSWRPSDDSNADHRCDMSHLTLSITQT